MLQQQDGESALKGIGLRVAILCGLVAMLDGFDTQAAAFVAPVLSKSWGIAPQTMGLVFAAGLIGIMAGQLLLGPLADRVGRRPIILFCTVAFAIGSLATLLATDATSLLVLRFLTGIGLGGATPNIIALTSEFAPARSRATVVTSMFAGFPLGGALGGLASAYLIPRYGWQAVFILGGIAPLLLFIVLCFALPESPHFARSTRGTRERHLAASWSTSVRALWSDGRAGRTAWVWFAFFNSLLVIYFLMNWLPSIARQSGLSLDSALVSSTFLNLGGALGGIFLGRLGDRLGSFRVLAFGYAVAGICLATLGGTSSASVLMLLVFIAGLFTIGGQTALNAAVTTLYPPESRATALGMALAIGRIGSIVGPVAGGALLQAQWALPAVFAVVAIPAFVVCACALALHAASRRTSRTGNTVEGRGREADQEAQRV